MTLQGIGFTDEVTPDDLHKILSATQPYISKVRPFQAEIGPAHVDAETIQAPVTPIDEVAGLRTALRQGINDAWGEQNVLEGTTGFRPHLTLAYSNGSLPMTDATKALNKLAPGATLTNISTVSLIDLNRDHQRYEWSAISTLRLGVQRGE